MNLILNENQYHKLILESSKENYKKQIGDNNNIVNKIIKNSKKDFGLDVKFILSWSVPIGGLISPIHELINGKMPNLNERDLSLITLGTIITYFYSNEKLLNKVLVLIKQNKLVNEFNYMLSKTDNLKTAFLDFLNSLKISINPISNVVSFTFFLNILPSIYNLVENGYDIKDIKPIVFGLLGYFGVKMSSDMISEVLEKMIKRFKS